MPGAFLPLLSKAHPSHARKRNQVSLMASLPYSIEKDIWLKERLNLLQNLNQLFEFLACSVGLLWIPYSLRRPFQTQRSTRFQTPWTTDSS